MAGIEAPVEDLFRPDPNRPEICVAMLEVSVHPGTDHVVETGASPWVFGEGDPEGKKRESWEQLQEILELSGDAWESCA